MVSGNENTYYGGLSLALTANFTSNRKLSRSINGEVSEFGLLIGQIKLTDFCSLSASHFL